MDRTLYESALEYHRSPKPGKFTIQPTKPLATQRDLSLAYSPGVAAACEEIHRDPSLVSELTGRGNLVAVISNGTAVLGLGKIGPLAAKPVMEGKAVLFKKFAGIDVFDLEIQETDPARLIDIIASLEPTFGGINLEDIKAPECFEIERQLSQRMKIPVFHDDQHGTAIIVAAAVLNGLELVKKNIKDVKLVCSGAGAAAIACLGLLEKLGLQKKNIFVTDGQGVIHADRPQPLDYFKNLYKQKTTARTLAEVMDNADIFLGLSVGNVLKAEMITKMAPNPLILALANPTPEIDPTIAKQERPDAIVATGRSDYPNQVNNVLCFPFMFRGALDVGATTINDDMKIACVRAIADLAKAELSDVVASAYSTEEIHFGPDYIIPKPFDPRLMVRIAPAVAKAAMASGVATRPIADLDAYASSLNQFIYRSSLAMKPIFTQAKQAPKRVVYTQGEEERVLRAAQIAVDEGVAHPILIGRRRVVTKRIARMGLRLKIGKNIELVDPDEDPRFHQYWNAYHDVMARHGVSPEFAKTVVRTNTTVIGALMVLLKDADSMLCGPVGRYQHHLQTILDVLGLKAGVKAPASMTLMSTNKGIFFFSDGYVNPHPTAEELAQATMMAAEQVQHFGLTPKVALLSHSNFGSSDSSTAIRVRETLAILRQRAPSLEIDGEMHADTALDPLIRQRNFPNSTLKDQANLLIMPDIDAANIGINLVKSLADGQPVGPLLLGLCHPAHILSSSTTVRGILNMTAYAVVTACGQTDTEKTPVKARAIQSTAKKSRA